MCQARLAGLTAIRIQEAFAEDERICVVQPQIIVLGDVVRKPEVSGILRISAGLMKFSDEIRLWLPLTPPAHAAGAPASVRFDPLANKLQELSLVTTAVFVPCLYTSAFGLGLASGVRELDKATAIGHPGMPPVRSPLPRPLEDRRLGRTGSERRGRRRTTTARHRHRTSVPGPHMAGERSGPLPVRSKVWMTFHSLSSGSNSTRPR